jgi:hypothetical protein
MIYTKEQASDSRRGRKKDAAHLLEALEALRQELGAVGEDIITIMREAGITPAKGLFQDETSREDG